MEPSSSSSSTWANGLPRPWWERSTVPCRDASPSDQCSQETWVITECETVVDPATGEPVKHCVKLFKRYLKCAGGQEKIDEKKHEMTARGQGAQQLEPNLVPPLELPGGRRSAAASQAPGAQIEDVGHAVQEFLRFAEELQEQYVPGAIHLDQVPPAPAQPHSEAEADEQQQQQQQHARQQGLGEQPLGWLGGLLFGRWRAECSGSRKRRVDASAWREFERDFTEV